MADEPSKRKLLPDGAGAHDDDFAAVIRGEARVGEVIAHMRKARGLELAEIAGHLRIRDVYLAAIEASDTSLLPGPTYAIGFVRSYANFLGLDGEEAVRLFKGEREGDAQKATLNFPEPVSESRIPRGAVLFISMILAVAAYGSWYYLSSRDSEVADLVPQVPKAMNPGAAPSASTASPTSTPTSTPASSPDAAKPATPAPDAAGAKPEAKPETKPDAASVTKAAPAVSPPVQPAPAPTVATKAPAPQAAPAAASAPTAPAPAPKLDAPAAQPAPTATPKPPAPTAATPAPAAVSAPAREAAAPAATPSAAPAGAPQAAAPAAMPAADQSAAARPSIEIKAKGDSWVQIRGTGGRVVVMRIFRTGDTFKVPDEKGLTLMTGNAGAIEITVDGKAVPAIGPFGAVRRDVPLDPERLKAGTAAR